MSNKEKNFKNLLFNQISERLKIFPIFVIGFFGLAWLASTQMENNDFWNMVTTLKFWGIFLGICILAQVTDAMLSTVYWFFRTRNPSYIKKQEAYERQKAEKDATRQSGKEDGESP